MNQTIDMKTKPEKEEPTALYSPAIPNRLHGKGLSQADAVEEHMDIIITQTSSKTLTMSSMKSC